MDVQSICLLFAISVPVSTILALQVWLAINGERGTLLLPGRTGPEMQDCSAMVFGVIAKAVARARLEQAARSAVAANDDRVDEAA